jgi:hypothetical protein
MCPLENVALYIIKPKNKHFHGIEQGFQSAPLLVGNSRNKRNAPVNASVTHNAQPKDPRGIARGQSRSLYRRIPCSRLRFFHPLAGVFLRTNDDRKTTD